MLIYTYKVIIECYIVIIILINISLESVQRKLWAFFISKKVFLTRIGMKLNKEKKKTTKAKSKEKKEKRNNLLAQELFALVLKLTVVVTFAFLFLQFIYGVIRYGDDSMQPAVKAGDVVLFYRLNKTYVASDVLALEYEGELQMRRVVAIEGDTVDITDEGLVINGNLQVEQQIYEETMPDKQGINYPVKLKPGEVFVLGDKRTAAVDSRIYGPIESKETLGKVITLLRRRSI